jgi:hypothetical protein
LNEKWIEDFWSDGNWGARQAVRDTEWEKKQAEKRKKDQEKAMDEYFRRRAKEMREEFYEKFGEDNFHEGPCCYSCWEDPIQDIGCCCNTGKYALENKDYKPKYPPVDGELPKEFEYFGPRTRERYLKRFQRELNPDVRNV